MLSLSLSGIPVDLVSFTVTALIGLMTLTFDLYNLQIGSHITRLTDFHRANFGLPRSFRSRVRSRHATDGQTDGQTDRHYASFYNVPSYGGRGHNN